MGKISHFFQKIIENNRLFWPLAILVFTLTRLAVWLFPFDSDHWIFYYVGRKLAEGGTLYVSAFDHKPPIIFVYNALIHLLFGGNLVEQRVFVTLFALLDIYLFYLLLKLFIAQLQPRNPLLTERLGLLFYIFFRNLSQVASSGNNTENLGLVFFLAMLFLYFSYQNRKKLWLLFGAGICLSFLFFLKGNFILLGLPIAIFLFIENLHSLRKLFLDYVVFGLPLVLHAGYWLYYFYSRKAVYDFLLGSFLFSAKYSRVAWSGNLTKNSNIALIVSFLLLPFAVFLALYLINFKKKRIEVSFFLSLYLLVSILITFGVGPAYPYYFLIVLPILILLAVTVFEDLSALPGFFKIIFYYLIILGITGSFAISCKQLYNSFAGPVKAELDEYINVAHYVNQNSKPSDKVFNYDYGATFYRLAERDSGSRFISASLPLLDEREHFGFGFDDIFIREMTENKTKFVVMPKDPNNIYYENKPLIDFFNQNYVEVKEFDRFKVLQIKK